MFGFYHSNNKQPNTLYNVYLDSDLIGVIESKKQNVKRDRFEELLLNKGLIYAAKHCYSWKVVLKNTVKKMIPKRIKPIIKSFAKKLLSKN